MGAASRATATHEGGAPRAAGLTRLRFVFIGWVVLYHLNLTLQATAVLPWLHPALGRGYLGVDGFFLLSGFALWLGYGARPVRDWAGMKQFLMRRLAKIWPLHALALVALALVVGLALAAGAGIRDPERFGAGDLVLQLLMLNAWETAARHSWNYPSWALSAEWAGYLAFPFVMLAVRRISQQMLGWAAVLLLALLTELSLAQGWNGLNLTIHLGLVRFFLEFALGMTVARLCLEWRPEARLLWPLVALLPLGLVLRQDAIVVAGLAALLAATWQAEQERLPRSATARPDLLLRLGEASFGVYLCWVFIEAALVGFLRVAQPSPGWRAALMVPGFGASLLAGWLAWRLVEVPAHRWVLSRPWQRVALPRFAWHWK